VEFITLIYMKRGHILVDKLGLFIIIILKGPSQPHICSCLHAGVWRLLILYLEDVEMKEITVKLLKMIKHTFRNTIYRKAVRFCFTVDAISIISMALKMAEVD